MITENKQKIKRSRIRKPIVEEVSDFEILRELTKGLREGRKERFEDVWFERLKIVCKCEFKGAGKYEIQTEEFGTIDFYPKANKLLIRKDNKWVKPGLRFIISKLIKNQV